MSYHYRWQSTSSGAVSIRLQELSRAVRSDAQYRCHSPTDANEADQNVATRQHKRLTSKSPKRSHGGKTERRLRELQATVAQEVTATEQLRDHLERRHAEQSAHHRKFMESYRRRHAEMDAFYAQQGIFVKSIEASFALSSPTGRRHTNPSAMGDEGSEGEGGGLTPSPSDAAAGGGNGGGGGGSLACQSCASAGRRHYCRWWDPNETARLQASFSPLSKVDDTTLTSDYHHDHHHKQNISDPPPSHGATAHEVTLLCDDGYATPPPSAMHPGGRAHVDHRHCEDPTVSKQPPPARDSVITTVTELGPRRQLQYHHSLLACAVPCDVAARTPPSARNELDDVIPVMDCNGTERFSATFVSRSFPDTAIPTSPDPQLRRHLDAVETEGRTGMRLYALGPPCRPWDQSEWDPRSEVQTRGSCSFPAATIEWQGEATARESPVRTAACVADDDRGLVLHSQYDDVQAQLTLQRELQRLNPKPSTDRPQSKRKWASQVSNNSLPPVAAAAVLTRPTMFF